MKLKITWALTLLATMPTTLAQPTNPPDALRELKRRAAEFNCILSLPHFELTTNEVRASVRQTIAVGSNALDRIGGLKPRQVTFENSVRALDDLYEQISLTANRLSILKETSTNALLRDTATDALKDLQEWTVGLDYREDVYKAVKAYADKSPKLAGEDAKLLDETMRDYRRAGLGLPKPLRDDVAKRLGYKTWADYQTEVKMVKNAATAIAFLEKLKTGLQPKFDAEVEELRQLKVKETGDATAQIHIWDWRYFSNQLKKEKYTVDAEQLRVYFPYQRVLEGMFSIYQSIFGLKFDRVQPPYKWIGDLQLYAVSDSQSGEPLGLFYLDMFPREGKYNHFAQFDIIQGKLLPRGKYQRPTVALICNFPSPAPDRPSLLSRTDVETLFHEFGHAMHSIMTRAKYARFSGTSVPRDFVEAPSQMLENWVWNKKVLDSFAADYRDPSKKIPAEILAKLKEAKLAVEATRYRRQLSFGLADLALHTQIHEANAKEALPLSNKILGEVFFPMAPDTAFVAYFGHLMQYDAGYYGYAWADAIAADMATVFEHAPNGYFDQAAGHRLRAEIYEPGDSRDVNVSIEKFLHRPWSLDPFLKKIGIEKSAAGAN